MQHAVLLSTIRHIDALAEGRHQRVQETGLLFLAVVLAQEGLDGAGGLLGLVEGDAAEEVVHDVVVDDLVEEVTADEARGAVNGGQRPLGVGPSVGRVVRDVGVGVLEVGDGDCGWLAFRSIFHAMN